MYTRATCLSFDFSPDSNPIVRYPLFFVRREKPRNPFSSLTGPLDVRTGVYDIAKCSVRAIAEFAKTINELNIKLLFEHDSIFFFDGVDRDRRTTNDDRDVYCT